MNQRDFTIVINFEKKINLQSEYITNMSALQQKL